MDFEAGVLRLERGTTKNGEARVFPFRQHARLTALLDELRASTSAVERETGRVVPFVFHRKGAEVKGWFHFGWRQACAKAGLDGRLFHDLRRSAIRSFVRAGVSEQVAMKLSGHKTNSILRRYNITSAADECEAVAKLAALHGSSVPEPRRVVPIREARAARTGTVRAQFRPAAESAESERRAKSLR